MLLRVRTTSGVRRDLKVALLFTPFCPQIARNAGSLHDPMVLASVAIMYGYNCNLRPFSSRIFRKLRERCAFTSYFQRLVPLSLTLSPLARGEGDEHWWMSAVLPKSEMRLRDVSP